MGIVEYFSLLVHAKFPQEFFLAWINVKDSSSSSSGQHPVLKWFDPRDLRTEVLGFTFLMTVVIFWMSVMFVYFKGPGDASDGVTIRLVYMALWIFSVISLSFFTCCFCVAMRFRRNLNQFLADFDELKSLLGADLKPTDEIPTLIDQKMVSTAKSVLQMEAAFRSHLVESMLNDERVRMRKADRLVARFGFTTKVWEGYFEQAREELKESIPA